MARGFLQTIDSGSLVSLRILLIADGVLLLILFAANQGAAHSSGGATYYGPGCPVTFAGNNGSGRRTRTGTNGGAFTFFAPAFLRSCLS